MNRRGLLKLGAALAPLSALAQRARTGKSALKITNVEAFAIRTPKDGTPPETTVIASHEVGLEPRRYAVPLNPEANKPRQ